MTASLEPQSGIYYGWDDGEQDWGIIMNENLLRLGRIGFHLSVKDRDENDPSNFGSSLAEGDAYIVGPGGVNEFSGQDGNIAYYTPNDTSSGWTFYAPRLGWMAYIEDEEKLSVFKGDSNGWSAGIAI